MKLYHSIPILAVLAIGCGPKRHSGVAAVLISGPIQIETPAAIDAGYAAAIAGGRWSIAFAWPEADASSQRAPMSMANGTPMLGISSDSQPAAGSHRIGPFPSSRIFALMEGPHLGTSWRSDSGTLNVTRSDKKSGAIAGSFTVWMRCTQRCPCAERGCVVEARGTFASPR